MPPHYFSYLIPLHPLPHYLSLSSSSSSSLLLSLSILLTTSIPHSYPSSSLPLSLLPLSHPYYLSPSTEKKEREVVRRRKEGERMTQRKERDVVMKWMERNEGGEVVRGRIDPPHYLSPSSSLLISLLVLLFLLPLSLLPLPPTHCLSLSFLSILLPHWMERNEEGEVVRRRIERKEGERQ
jgi:hypothetical protein